MNENCYVGEVPSHNLNVWPSTGPQIGNARTTPAAKYVTIIVKEHTTDCTSQ